MFIDRVFMNRLFRSRIFIDRVFMNSLFRTGCWLEVL